MKKGLLVLIIVIIIVILVAAGYYFIFRKPAQPTVWDGNYKTEGVLTCEGNIPNLTTIPMTSTTTVANNKIIEQIQDTTQTFAIDKKGKALEVLGPIVVSGVTTSGRIEYQFSREKSVYKFTSTGSMTLGITKDGKDYSSTCSGTVNGVKQ